MEVQVKCSCGSVYSFEETPVNGRLPYPVSCGNCGVDGTAIANEFIARVMAGEPGPMSKPKRNFHFWGSGRKRKPPIDDSLTEPAAASKFSVRFFLSAVACLITGLLGAYAWRELARATGYEFGMAAWGVGVLVGLSARMLVPQGGLNLAAIAAGCAALGIIGGQYLVTKWDWERTIEGVLPTAYAQSRGYAEEAMQLETDQEIREFLAERKLTAPDSADAAAQSAVNAEQQRHLFRLGGAVVGVMSRNPGSVTALTQSNKAADPEKITAEQVASFRQNERAELKRFLEGEPSQAAFQSSLKELIHSKITFTSLLTKSLGIYSLLWLGLGIISAYKLTRNTGLKYSTAG